MHCASRVSAVSAGQLTVENGGSTAFYALLWCTGAAAGPWVGASGLRTVQGGFLAVHDTLQSVDDPVVFAAGDIATQLQHPRPKAGVYAVRQAPVLAANLRNLLLQRPLRAHRPQQRFLSLLSLGERRAVAERGPFVASGAWAWRWKDRIDRRFMAQFAALPEGMPNAAADTLPEALAAATQAPCGGCGAKVGGDRLAAALGELRQRYPQHCPTTDGAEDAAVVTAPAGGIQLQSLDILRGLVSDPWLMGRIAANHALSDLYASGAQPTTALAALAPELTYYLCGFSKSLGAGLRIAYLALPSARLRSRLAVTLRATTVMASPITAALASCWVQDGTADLALTLTRRESQARQELVAEILAGADYRSHPEAFHVWLRMPPAWSRVAFAARLRAQGINVVVSDAFAVNGKPPEAVRLCLGGPASRQDLGQALHVIADALQQPGAASAGFF